MSFKNLLYEMNEGLVRITVNRPEKLNALNRETVSELDSALTRMEADPEARALIITGSGSRAFVAGADIKELSDLSPEAGKEYARTGQGVLDRIEGGGRPVIAAINGFALGGGLELALACHMRIASESASMGLPEVTLGLIPGFGGTQRLPRLIGRGKALELITTGSAVDAKAAQEIGLVNRVVAADQLLESAEKMARTIMKRGPVSVARAIEAVNRGLDVTQEKGMAIEARLFGDLMATEDTKEGTAAFLEKRKPGFVGR